MIEYIKERCLNNTSDEGAKVIYVISDNLLTIEKIGLCLEEKDEEYKIVSFFFPHRREEKWISVGTFIKECNDGAVIVAIENQQTKDNMIATMNCRGYELTNFFDFDKVQKSLVPFNHIDKAMLKNRGTKLDGIILGISHGKMGINSDCFPENHNYVNLALDSQDIYYNYKVLEYLIRNYPQEVVSVKHVIIDMFDYSYFNYDISLARYALVYYNTAGCFWGPHHFNENKAYDFSFDELKESIELKHDADISDEEKQIWDNWFGQYFELEKYDSVRSDYSLEVCTKEEAEKFDYGDIAYNTFPDTLEENRKLFKQLLDLILAINPQMSIHLILLPRSPEVEKREISNEYIQVWKDYFYKEITYFNELYSFDFWNLKEDNDLDLSMNDYFDAVHLNLFGAIKVTNAIVNNIYGNDD